VRAPQIDFLEGAAAARRIEIEQRALRDRLADRAFDVAGRQFAAALDLLVEAFEHAARLFAGAARAVDGDVIAALFGDGAKAPFDQRKVFAILAEQQRGKFVILEREHDLRGRRLLGGGGGRDHGIRCSQGGAQAPAAASDAPLAGA
jgi:hypothetical protein